MLKYFALITMTLDHSNRIMNLNIHFFYILGRFAFPIFAFLIVRNYLYYSKSFNKYALRLVLFGLISEPLYKITFDINSLKLNIFFTLLSGLFLLKSLKENDYMLMIITILFSLFCEYNLIGLNLIFSIYLLFKYTFNNNKQKYLVYAYLFVSIFLLLIPNYIFLTPIITVMIIYVSKNDFDTYSIKKLYKYKYFKYLFYIYYPFHLAILELIK